MFKTFALAGAVASAVAIAAPAHAATVVYGASNPGGNVTLTPAGPGAVSSGINFDVQGTDGAFTATFNFTNPYNPAVGQASSSFNFDPDIIQFTSGAFSGLGSSFVTVFIPGIGASVQVDIPSLATGMQTLMLSGTLTRGAGPRANSFARIGGSITLTGGAVPEPTTWALFILGFGAIGGFMRRRNVQIRTVKQAITFA